MQKTFRGGFVFFFALQIVFYPTYVLFAEEVSENVEAIQDSQESEQSNVSDSVQEQVQEDVVVPEDEAVVEEVEVEPAADIDPYPQEESVQVEIEIEESQVHSEKNETPLEQTDNSELILEASNQEVIPEEGLKSSETIDVSSTTQPALPFELISQKINFEINEIPSFVFSYRLSDADNKEENPILNIVDDAVDTFANLYEGSVVEAIIDSMVEVVDAVVDFVVPIAEGQEPEVILQDQEVEDEVLIVEDQSVPEKEEILEHEEILAEEISSLIASSTQEEVVEENPTEVTFPTTTPLSSFGLVDTVRFPVHMYDDAQEGIFTVDFGPILFDVGSHNVELHLYFQGEMHVIFYSFTVDGVVVSTMPLSETLFAVTIEDESGSQTLWLKEVRNGLLHSYEKLADEASMTKNPVLAFEGDTLFWTTPNAEALIGFDTVSRTLFSQTLNLGSRDENLFELQTGTYDVSVSDTAIDMTLVPENSPI